MKKNILYIITIVILLIVSVYLIFIKGNKSTIDPRDSDFAIKEIKKVDRIFLVDKSNQSILLEKKNNTWFVNKKYKANVILVGQLLDIIANLSVKSPVPKPARENIIKFMSASSTKVEIYSGKNKLKCYYVGSVDNNMDGNYMLLEDAKIPFVMRIDGFAGTLNPYFSTSESSWRHNVILEYKPAEIKSISVIYPQQNEHSFLISNNNKQFKLFAIKESKEISDFDTTKIINYFNLFNLVGFEESLNDAYSKKIKDSILHSTPKMILEMTNKQGKIERIKCFIKENSEGILDNSSGEPLKYDFDRMYAFINNDKELVLVQYYTFDPIMMSWRDFLKNKNQ